LFDDIKLDEDRELTKRVEGVLEEIAVSVKANNCDDFERGCNTLWRLLGFEEPRFWVDLLETIMDEKYHCVFRANELKNVAITCHASKGLEFDNVVIFATDYDFENSTDLCNHYVASTRARNNLFIVYNSHDRRCKTYIKYMSNVAKALELKFTDVYIVNQYLS